MNAQYQHERQVRMIIDTYHRDAIKAEQLRLARGTQLNGITLLTMRLRGAVTTLGMRLRHRPAVVQDPVIVPTLTDAPTTSAVVI